jgi:hypothetical protein
MNNKDEKQLIEIHKVTKDVTKCSIFTFFTSKDLINISLVNKEFFFLSEDELQFNKFLHLLEKSKLDDAKNHLKSFSEILNNQEHLKRFIKACLEKGDVKKIQFLLDTCPDLIKHKDYQPLFFSYLLLYGVKANQDAAELLIKNNIKLLKLKGNVTDDSGRHFKNVSFLQLLVYNLDVRYMWGMVYDRLLENKDKEQSELIRQELESQLDELLTYGLSYELTIGHYLPKTEEGNAKKEKLIIGFKKLIELGFLNYELKDDKLIIKNECHFDLKKLIKTKLYYADHFNDWDMENSGKAMNFWRTVVGLLQTLLPLYIRQHYCNPDEAFYPIPSFDKKEFKRSLSLKVWIDKDNSEILIFDGSLFNLGLNLGIDRVAGELAIAEGVSIRCNPGNSPDSGALEMLFERRLKDLELLKKQLKETLIKIEENINFNL